MRICFISLFCTVSSFGLYDGSELLHFSQCLYAAADT